jgi:hypothetical protein
MRRSTQVRKLRRPNMSRRAPSDVRTSDLVLGVMVVALLGLLCLTLLSRLAGVSDDLAVAPPSAYAS